MATMGAGPRVDDLAQELFEWVTHLFLATPRKRRRVDDLREVEFLTLALLRHHETMIVGDIQRLLGVLPAQMSRIIRSLENRPAPLIQCQINTRDKRKIDVRLTDAGAKALLEYQTYRFQRIIERLRELPEEEHEELNRLLEKLRALLALPH
jgi:DNA-binding MarR family transcriptional regulator